MNHQADDLYVRRGRLIERIAMEARQSEYVDQKSGVSARLTITALESLYSTCERRMTVNGETSTRARIADLYGIIPAITGKVELVYEGEVEGIGAVAQTLIGKAIRKEFAERLRQVAEIDCTVLEPGESMTLE